MEQNFGEIVVSIFNIAIMGGIALTVFMIVFQGINLLNSRGDTSAFSRAKEKIKNTLIGLGVLLLSYVLIYTINPNILDVELNIGEISITPPAVITPKPPVVKELDTYTFEEIPLGTITEAILAGVSSIDVPCYQYETRLRDASGNIIIGNVVDQNKDGKIDEKDILLNKDLFYCTKLLTDAYAAKIEHHLYSLTKELDSLMEQCTCSRCYTGRYEGAPNPSHYGQYQRQYWCCSEKSGRCSPYYCNLPYSYCNFCCGAAEGCPNAQPSEGGLIINPIVETIEEFNQYLFDPCPNRLELQCKKEEINWLITGEKPKDICFSQGLIKETAPKAPILLTLDDGIERIEFFRDYYQTHLNNLSEAKAKMKVPWGERITLAEFNKIQNEATNYKIEKTTFKDYEIFKYCRNFNSSGVTDTEPCKIIDDQREYFYDGDEATFYFSEDYNALISKINKSTEEKKCSVIEGEMEKGFYSGVIPIGEVVDEAQDWGTEVINRINLVLEGAVSLEKEAEILSGLSEKCKCQGNCQSGNDLFYCAGSYSCSQNECSCSVYSWQLYSCESCVPSTSLGGTYEYRPCFDRCSYGSQNRRVTKPNPAPQYWVCPYGDFCETVKSIYWEESSIGDDCFKPTYDEDEQKVRNKNMDKTGYLQKFKGYSTYFIELAEMKINTPAYGKANYTALIDSICPSERNYREFNDGEFSSCDSDLSIKVESRFNILEKLSYSRKKFTGCVKGYGAGYKDNPTEVIEVISCMEGITDPGVLILPEFPYPGKGNVNPPYNNCYPQNSDRLTEDERSQCFYNPLREGTASNPGCLLITKEYTDNYYCCN